MASSLVPLDSEGNEMLPAGAGAAQEGDAGDGGDDGAAAHTRSRTAHAWVLKLTMGNVRFSRAEGDYYTGLFRILSDGGDAVAAMGVSTGAVHGDPVEEAAAGRLGTVKGAEGAAFLRRSDLPDDQLREVWRLASGGKSRRALGLENWFLAMRLIAFAQKTGELDLERMVAGTETLRMPEFDVDPDPDLSLGDPTKVVADAAIRVEVGAPTTIGSGLSKHTVFTITTTTSLPYWSRKDAVVYRRYRDVVWLHDRLCSIFPGVIIPPIPGKKLVGNMDAEFVEARRAALEDYLNRVTHHPRLAKDSFDLQTFLVSTSDGLAALKYIIESGVSRGPMNADAAGAAEFFSNMWGSISSGVGSLFEGRASLPADIGVDEKYNRACAFHQSLHGSLSKAVGAADALERAQRQTAYATARLGAYVLEAAAVEQRGERVGSAAVSAKAKRDAERGRAASSGGAGSAETAPGWGADSWAGATSGTWAGAKPEVAEAKKPAPPVSTALINPNVGVMGHARAAEEAAALFEETEDAFGGRGLADEYKTRTAMGLEAAGGGGAATTTTAAPATESGDATGGAGAGLPGQEVQTAAEALRKLGSVLDGAANRLQDQLDAQAEVFFQPLRFELEQASAIKDAMARREDYMSRLASGTATLKAKKKRYAKARADSMEAEEAEADMYKAEVDVASVERNVGAITESLKLEMTVRDSQRKHRLARVLLEHVRLEAKHAKSRADRWSELLTYVTRDEALLAASRERTAVKDYEAEPEPTSGDEADKPSPFA